MDEKEGHQRREYTRNRPLGRDRYGNEYWRLGGDTRLVLVRRHGCWWGLYDGPEKVCACARSFLRVLLRLVILLVVGGIGIGRGVHLLTDQGKTGCFMVDLEPVKGSVPDVVWERSISSVVIQAYMFVFHLSVHAILSCGRRPFLCVGLKVEVPRPSHCDLLS